jgi:hypothetical protein
LKANYNRMPKDRVLRERMFRNMHMLCSYYFRGSTVVYINNLKARRACADATLLPPIKETFRIGSKVYERFCDHCFKTKSDGVTLKRCNGCQGYRYCSRECQRRDWWDHKMDCEQVQRIRRL